MKKYLLVIIIISLWLLAPLHLLAQVKDTVIQIDKPKNLFPYAIKLERSLKTKYGSIIYRPTKQKAIREKFEICLIKENGEEQILWVNKTIPYRGTNISIRNYILEEDFFSFILTSGGIEWIICEKQKDGNWEETFRTYLEHRIGQESFPVELTFFMPDKKTVTIKRDGFLIRINGKPPILNVYKLTPDKKITRNGMLHELNINLWVKKWNAYYEKNGRK